MESKPVKIYFASDFHLGTPNFEESLIRERKIVYWLEEVRKDATEIFLMGDLFDFGLNINILLQKDLHDF